MRLSLRVLGLELLAVEISTDTEEPEARIDDIGSTPIGFTASPGDQRYEPGIDLCHPRRSHA